MKFTSKGSILIIVSFNEQTEMLNVNVQDTGLGVKQDD